MSKIIESAINWYGGKGGTGQRKLLMDILNYIQKSECTKFVDVFGGSGIVCLNALKEIRIYNDIDEELANLFEVIKDKNLSAEFIKQLTLTPYSEKYYKESKEKLKYETNKVERALFFYVLTMQSRNATGAQKDNETWSVSRNKSRRGMAQAVSRYLHNIDENLPDIIEIVREWQITNDNCFRCLERWDDKETIFYLDPPYVKETRIAKKVYKNEFSHDQQSLLVQKLLSLKGDAVISGYDNDIYAELTKVGWFKIKYQIKTATSGEKENPTRDEVLWCKRHL